MSRLHDAARAVLERWDSPKWDWEKPGPTADLMAELRAALASDAAAPAESAGPVAHTSERHFALREAHGHADEAAYFAARPQLDGDDRRSVFRAGHQRGFDAAEKVYAHPPAKRVPLAWMRPSIFPECEAVTTVHADIAEEWRQAGHEVTALAPIKED